MLNNICNEGQLTDFINLPELFYKKDLNWVKPRVGAYPWEFNVRTNPILKYHEMKLFLTSNGKNLTGRIAAFIDNRYNSIHKEKTAFFGFFESQNNLTAARELFSAAEGFAHSKGMSRIIGPVEFTTNYQAGILVKGFSRPTVMTAYNKSYYPKLLESGGFSKLMDLYAYKFNAPFVPERMQRMYAIQKKRNPKITILNFNQAGRLCSPSMLTKLYNQAFYDTWGFVPMSTKEFSSLLQETFLMNHWDLNYLAFYGRNPVGLLLTVPDLNEPQTPGQAKNQQFNTLRITVLGVQPSFRKRGIETRMGVMLINDAVAKGYKSFEFSYILENNTAMLNYVDREFGIPVSKTFRIYEKPVP